MLRERLVKRGTPDDIIKRRMDEFEAEHACRTRFDTIINNDDGRLDQAYAEFKAALGL
jgi:guanylate kinase